MHADSHPQPTSNKVDAKKPNMGGLAEGHCRKEAWTSRKINSKWTGLDDQRAIDFPLPTQMGSTSTKAATSLLKRMEGLFLMKHADLRQETAWTIHAPDLRPTSRNMDWTQLPTETIQTTQPKWHQCSLHVHCSQLRASRHATWISLTSVTPVTNKTMMQPNAS